MSCSPRPYGNHQLPEIGKTVDDEVVGDESEIFRDNQIINWLNGLAWRYRSDGFLNEHVFRYGCNAIANFDIAGFHPLPVYPEGVSFCGADARSIRKLHSQDRGGMRRHDAEYFLSRQLATAHINSEDKIPFTQKRYIACAGWSSDYCSRRETSCSTTASAEWAAGNFVDMGLAVVPSPSSFSRPGLPGPCPLPAVVVVGHQITFPLMVIESARIARRASLSNCHPTCAGRWPERLYGRKAPGLEIRAQAELSPQQTHTLGSSWTRAELRKRFVLAHDDATSKPALPNNGPAPESRTWWCARR